MSMHGRNMVLLESFSIPVSGIIAAVILYLILGQLNITRLIGSGSIIVGFFTFL